MLNIMIGYYQFYSRRSNKTKDNKISLGFGGHSGFSWDNGWADKLIYQVDLILLINQT